MPTRGRPKKIQVEEEDFAFEEASETPIAGFVQKSELEAAIERQTELLALREKLVINRINSIGDLDVILGAVNQRIKELS